LIRNNTTAKISIGLGTATPPTSIAANLTKSLNKWKNSQINNTQLIKNFKTKSQSKKEELGKFQ
jgi:hypothetical protein